MTESIVSCPAAISFIFKYCPNDDPLLAGSIGVGSTIDKQVAVSAKKAPKTAIFFNTQPISFPTVADVINKLAPEPVEVSIQSPLPLGCGFGISGASALATTYAINQLFNLKKSKKELSEIAHIAEINNKTGLGTVATQITGGFLLKQTPGIVGKMNRLPLEGQKLFATILGPLTTPSVLENREGLKRVAKAADLAMEKINLSERVTRERDSQVAPPPTPRLQRTKAGLPAIALATAGPAGITLENILDISYDFVKESGLLNDVEMVQIIDEIRSVGGHATMAILGRMVLSDKKPDTITGYCIEELTITNTSISTNSLLETHQ